jgi:hypothetical protein
LSGLGARFDGQSHLEEYVTTESSRDDDRVEDLTASDFRIASPSDVLELVAMGVERLVMSREQINADFFDLSTGFAGEVVQKCMNYGLRVAVVGDFEDRSASFRQFAVESSKGSRFVFVRSVAEGLARLAP